MNQDERARLTAERDRLRDALRGLLELLDLQVRDLEPNRMWQSEVVTAARAALAESEEKP